LSAEISVKKELKSPEHFMQLDKKSGNSLNIKAAHTKRKTKSLSIDSLTIKDSLSFKKLFENTLLGKISEKENIKKEEIKPQPKIAEKKKAQDLKQDFDFNALLPQQTAIKPESLSANAAKNIELKDLEQSADRIQKEDKAVKEKSSSSRNTLLQLFEKNSIEKNGFNISYYLNQNNNIEKNTNLKENNELKKEKEKKEFFKIVDLRKNSALKNTEFLKSFSGKEGSEISQASRFTFLNNNINQNNVDLKDLLPDSQMQLSNGKLQQLDTSLMSSKNSISSFQSQFLEYLRENGNTNIVRNANIILKENNEGEIKLLMKPESLGYVRIKLMLNDSHIAGRIIVDNHNVKEIFENNIENLIKSFKESGYSSATIDVAVGGEQNNKEKQSMENDKVLVLKEIEKASEHTIIRTMLSEDRLVDMVI